MSSETEDRSSPDKDFEACGHSQQCRQSKISYSREFLLSLSELEFCKKLPSGFDASILSEFEEASYGVQDRRIPGSSPFQSYRRNEYGSSPPMRGDSGSYSRGSYGRWDSRSSGHSDRDSESQSDWGSDSSRRHGNHSRRSWQSFEHDGLLGSGSFARPSGYASGVSAPKARASDHSQLNRNNEPYHPPRPYKAVPHSRIGTNDSRNDETFGSSDSTSEDRVEEEKRRRAAFEMMRKEQRKALEEKQKGNVEKPKVESVSDISALLDDTVEKKSVGGTDALDVSVTPADSNDTGKSAILNQTSTVRPLVPPGFANALLEKNAGVKPLVQTHEAEVARSDLEEIVHPNLIHDGLDRKPSHGSCFSDKLEDKTMQACRFDDKSMSFTESTEVSNPRLGKDHLLRTSSLSETLAYLVDPEISAEVSSSKLQGESSEDHSSSILEKIFGSALNVGEPIEQIDSKQEKTWTSNTVQSSKFAHWFIEEEKKPEDDVAFDRPNDLLSLIVSGDKGRSQLPNGNATEQFLSESSHSSSELAKNLISDIPSAIVGVPQQLNNATKIEAISPVLTCEDLEQTILSEFSGNTSNLQGSFERTSVTGENFYEQPSKQVDDPASQHLLLLLKRGTDPNHMASSSHTEAGSDKDVLVSEGLDIHPTFPEPIEDAKGIHTAEKALTLETLFGSAFMKELQSAEAPISVQRGANGSAQTNVLEPRRLSIPLVNNGLLDSIGDETGPDRTTRQNKLLPINNELEKMDNWVGLDSSRVEVNSLKHQNDVIPTHDSIGEAVKFQLPKEECLINPNGPLDPQSAMFMPAATSNKGETGLNAPFDIMKKLAASGLVVKEDKSSVGPGGSHVQNPYGRIEPEIPHHNLVAQTPSSQFRSPQVNCGSQLFYPLDAHPARMNSQMNFLGPEGMLHHDPSASHQFPINMVRPPFPRPNIVATGYDLPAHQGMLSPLQMSGNYPPHLPHNFHRSTALPQPANQSATSIAELNGIQGFPFGTPQTNIGGPGMPMPAPEINHGTNHPEAFQKLLEMELRAKSKQFHPHSQGLYSHELDMGFRFR